ncbi:MAG TPA: 50S ribosomal protein L23 [Patescibacteria group bacterium]|nr:50S ribosomal protein L23 [Patescibacteria group bacterium]
MKNVIIRPIITEKSMNQAGKGKYTFHVANTATKQDIKASVEKFFTVDVLAVATMNNKGGSIRTGVRRVEKKRQHWKKAIVTIKAGQKITLFENVA